MHINLCWLGGATKLPLLDFGSRTIGTLGGGVNISENLSGFVFTLRVSLHKRIELGGGGGGKGQTELISVRGRRLPVGVPANAPAHRLLN